MARFQRCHSHISCLEALGYYFGVKWLTTATFDVLVNKPPVDLWRKKCELQLFSGKLLLIPSSGIRKWHQHQNLQTGTSGLTESSQNNSIRWGSAACRDPLKDSADNIVCETHQQLSQKSTVEEVNHSVCEEFSVIFSPMYFAFIFLFTYTQGWYVILKMNV